MIGSLLSLIVQPAADLSAEASDNSKACSHFRSGRPCQALIKMTLRFNVGGALPGEASNHCPLTRNYYEKSSLTIAFRELRLLRGCCTLEIFGKGGLFEGITCELILFWANIFISDFLYVKFCVRGYTLNPDISKIEMEFSDQRCCLAGDVPYLDVTFFCGGALKEQRNGRAGKRSSKHQKMDKNKLSAKNPHLDSPEKIHTFWIKARFCVLDASEQKTNSLELTDGLPRHGPSDWDKVTKYERSVFRLSHIYLEQNTRTPMKTRMDSSKHSEAICIRYAGRNPQFSWTI